MTGKGIFGTPPLLLELIGSDTDIYTVVRKIMQKYPVDNVTALCNALNINVGYMPKEVESMPLYRDGYCNAGSGGITIYLRNDMTRERKRHCAAVQLGHIILGHITNDRQPIEVYGKGENPLDSERAAEVAAGMLLYAMGNTSKETERTGQKCYSQQNYSRYGQGQNYRQGQQSDYRRNYQTGQGRNYQANYGRNK